MHRGPARRVTKLRIYLCDRGARPVEEELSLLLVRLGLHQTLSIQMIMMITDQTPGCSVLSEIVSSQLAPDPLV